ncbi:response regulator [Deinococcus maricopensis]|uniref:Two component transcriptional regulator, LuxR family n=1 Tax=Deinococcus maricopensis (strain DSM 21211 / LMG 22137 / NRRL B-23946 / LB-34) TaxID=709986 RepID=E8U7R0_DEIML|nr:response regulator transcription factor [Deinococcus maricopensis]ADV67099.1 two component transcriptional regulator, LuxR family [Deinococcus maricopensis DSM 21211]
MDDRENERSGRVIRVLVVDDQPWVRVGLRTLLDLEEGVSVAAEAASGEDAVAWVDAHPGDVDVVLMDVRMPGMGGVEATAQLRARSGPPVVLLTTFEEEDAMVGGLQAGASGYLLKDVDVVTLRDTIVRVARGERYVQPRVAEVLADALSRERRGVTVTPERLTPRETEILALIARGLANKRIAQALTLTEGTVKVHVSNILGKLGATDRLDAVRVAREAGLLDV